MLQSQIVVFFYVSFLTLVSARAIDRRQVTGTSESFSSSTVTHVAVPTESSTTSSSLTTTTKGTITKTASLTSTPTPTYDDSSDDQGEYIPPPPPDESYFQNEGADGSSTGFINVSIGAQAGIIIAIVLVGLGIMGGCVWFWKKKQAEWKAALERRRTLRASRIAAAKAAGVSTGKKRSKKVDGVGSKASGIPAGDKNGSASTLVSKEAKPVEPAVERSHFDVMTPTEEENPSWWRKVLPKKK